MRVKRTVLGLVALSIAVAVVASLTSACAGTSGEPAEQPVSIDGETLLQERCTVCHGLERTTSAQKTRAEWDDTVTRMMDKGAELSDEEKTVLVDYLAENHGP